MILKLKYVRLVYKHATVISPLHCLFTKIQAVVQRPFYRMFLSLGRGLRASEAIYLAARTGRNAWVIS